MRLCPATPEDTSRIADLHERHNHRPADRDAIAAAVRDFPAAIAVDSDDRLRGFAYCGRFAPDMLELRNLLVDPELRSRGLGGLLLRSLEDQAAGTWAAVILVNSLAYPAPGKRSAAAFYQRHGYTRIWDTTHTAVLAKNLTDPSARHDRTSTPR